MIEVFPEFEWATNASSYQTAWIDWSYGVTGEVYAKYRNEDKLGLVFILAEAHYYDGGAFGYTVQTKKVDLFVG